MNSEKNEAFAAIRRAAGVARYYDGHRRAHISNARYAIEQMEDGKWDVGDSLVEIESLFDSAYVNHAKAEAIRYAIRLAIASNKA